MRSSLYEGSKKGGDKIDNMQHIHANKNIPPLMGSSSYEGLKNLMKIF